MAPRYADLQRLSRDDLIKMYDKEAENVHLSLKFYATELQRRDLQEHNSVITKLTRAMAGMTLVILLATIVNIVLFALD